MKPKILILDDEASVRESLQQLLSRDFVVATADSADCASRLWLEEKFDLLLLDILLQENSGLSILKDAKKLYPDLPVIMITGTKEIKTAVEAMKAGAYDYLTKPFNVEELRSSINGALKPKIKYNGDKSANTAPSEEVFFGTMVGRSPVIMDVFKRITQVMNTHATVLIQGESGTGKELVARAIHYNGMRKERPFIPVHIASLSGSLIESELFGHEKGAFTGAIQAKKGTIEIADGGTLFLDEIGDIPIPIQVKLLRVLQEREVRRVGSIKDKKVDVRFIAATNKDIGKMVENGVFREDLYYRISVVPIKIPSLRERIEDIPALVNHFVEKFRKNKGPSAVKGFDRETIEVLKNYYWPGNVRELENLVERLIFTCDVPYILPDNLPRYILTNEMICREPDSLEETISAHERKIIEEALLRNDWVVAKAANSLGTTRRILRYKMDKLGISNTKLEGYSTLSSI